MDKEMGTKPSSQRMTEEESKRREFLKTAGKFAAYTPPAVMLLMHPSANAVMKSAISRGNNGIGQEKRGIIDGPPPGLAKKPNMDFNDNGNFAPYGQSGAKNGGRPF